MQTCLPCVLVFLWCRAYERQCPACGFSVGLQAVLWSLACSHTAWGSLVSQCYMTCVLNMPSALILSGLAFVSTFASVLFFPTVCSLLSLDFWPRQVPPANAVGVQLHQFVEGGYSSEDMRCAVDLRL
jgi:hypothetical protein